MAFSFTHQQGVASQVRGIAMAEAAKAVAEAHDGRNFDETVHRLRRRCKKLRGLLRLIEPDFENFAVENAAVQAAAEQLGDARDAAVLVETFRLLAGWEGSKIPIALADALLGHLADRAGVIGATKTREDLLGYFADALESLAERANAWAFSGHGLALLSGGLGLSYRRMRRGLARALKHSDDAEVLHEWREHVKYHLFHTKLFRMAAPDVLEPRAKLLARLGDALGDHHNLAVLAQTLSMNAGPASDEGVELVHRAIHRRQTELAEQAFDLGRQVSVEKPAALEDRYALYWRLLPGEAPDGS